MFHLLNIIHYILTFLTLNFPIVQPLSFNITNFSDESASNISYSGVAKNISNGSLVLNTLNINGIGRAIYGQPMCLKNSSNGVVTDFSTRFSFTIDVSNKSNYGDGFAFYMASPGSQNPPNSGGGGLGLYSDGTIYNIVAVEFDTFVNVNADPTMRHVGINNNSVVSLAYSSFDIDNNIGKMGHVLITYNASTKILVVSWFFEGSSKAGFKPNTSLSHQIDLGEFLPEWVTVGFSGATGLSAEENVIHSWEFNSTLNSNASTNSTDVSENKKHTNSSKIVMLVVAVTCPTVLVVVVAGFTVYVILNKKRESVGENDEGGLTLVKFDLDRATIPRRFEYKELIEATKEFADDRKLGQGGCGQVYKGVLSYLGRVVAVKKIFASFENSERVFINEVRIISRLIHKNLVQFIGWCHEQGEFLLVFEYMPNGSLDTHLFGDKKTLAWDVRYKVALGVAAALRYLHEEAEQCVLHRDIKSANVLLDTDFNTKLGDFGMAKLVDPRSRTQRTGVVGTYGYLAPEYIDEGKASRESDMYSFGVVALEIACGRRTYRDGEFHVPLVNWVWQLYVGGNVLDAVDERLIKEFDVDQMTSLLIVGLWCTHPNDKERPKAAEVIKVLQLEAPLPVLPLDMHDGPLPSIITQQPNHSLQSLVPPITNSFVSVGR